MSTSFVMLFYIILPNNEKREKNQRRGEKRIGVCESEKAKSIH